MTGIVLASVQRTILSYCRALRMLDLPSIAYFSHLNRWTVLTVSACGLSRYAEGNEGRELDAHDECVLRRSSWNARKYRSRTARGSPRCAWVCCEDFAHAIANDFSTLYWHAITYPTQRSVDSVDVLSKPSTFLHFGLTCCIQHTELLANSRKRCVTGTTFNPALLVPRRAPPCGLNIARLTVMCSVRVLRAACA